MIEGFNYKHGHQKAKNAKNIKALPVESAGCRWTDQAAWNFILITAIIALQTDWAAVVDEHQYRLIGYTDTGSVRCREFFITHLYDRLNAKHGQWAKANLDAAGFWEAATGHSAAWEQDQLILKELNLQHMAKSDAQWIHSVLVWVECVLWWCNF